MRILDLSAVQVKRYGRVILVLLTGLLVGSLPAGCGKGTSSEVSRPSTGNAALDAALAKEAVLEGEFSVDPASMGFTATTKLRPTVSIDEGIEKISMQLPDAGGEIACFVYSEEGNVGGSAVRLGLAGVELLENEVESFEAKRINGLYAGVADGADYHGVEWLLVGSGGSELPKAIAANKYGRGLACLHLGLGYGRSFERVFRGLLESFSVETPPPAPYFSEIVVSKLGDLKVGIESTNLTLDQDGDTEIRTAASVLIPVSESELAATISSGQSWSRPNGTLINAHVTEADEAEEHTLLSLAWVQDEGWRASGTFQGKELDSMLPHSGPIDTKLRELVILTSLLSPKGDQTTATMIGWVPDIDPTDVIQSKITTLPGDPLQVRVEAAEISFDMLRGEDGLLDSGTLSIGSSTLKMNVVHREGGL